MSATSDQFYAGGVASATATWLPTDSITMALFMSINVSFDDTDNWNGLIRFTTAATLTEIFSAGVIAEMNYANQPAAGFKNTDFRLVATFGVTLS